MLALRVGLRLARALDRFAPEPLRLKWPNDLYVDDKKLAGILIEARWRESRLEWVAIGLVVVASAGAALSPEQLASALHRARGKPRSLEP